jgi:hypothetical protein
MAPKSGRHLFRSRFFIHIVYYFSESLLRIILISIYDMLSQCLIDRRAEEWN